MRSKDIWIMLKDCMDSTGGIFLNEKQADDLTNYVLDLESKTHDLNAAIDRLLKSFDELREIEKKIDLLKGVEHD